MKFFKRQKKDNIELDEVYRLLKGYYRCSYKEGYPFLFVSDDFLNTLHWTQKEIETKFDNKLVNMLHPEDRSRLEKDRDLLRNQYKVGTCQNVVFRLKGKDGYHWVSDCYLALKQDSTFFFQGNITDVTSFMLDKEKRAEERNQMLTALTMEYSTVIMGDLMENTMVVVKHDGHMYDHGGLDDFSSEDKMNYTRCLRDFYNRVLVKESCPDFLDILSPVPFMNALLKNETVELQYQIYPNSNGYESLYARAIRLYDEKHHFRFVMGFRPMDEVRKKENVLELQREIIEGISKDYFSVLLVELDQGQIYSYREAGSNGKRIADFCRSYHDRWTELLPAYAKDLVSDASRENFLEELSFEKLKSCNEDYSFTYEYMSDEGVLYYQARVSYVKKKDRTRAVVIGTRDIDDLIQKERLQKEQLRKAYIQAENASKAKTDFLNSMSHDICTPMNVILGYNQLMKKKLSDPVLVDYQKKIEQSGNLLLSIINDVLNMARIESGKSVLVESSESIVDMVEEVSNVFGAMAKEKEIVFDTKMDIKHKQVLCDSTKVKEILVNLIGNAIKYTPNGGHVTVDIKEFECSKEGYGTYQIQIIDTGIGMSESFIPTLFDAFTREATSDIIGTGLGMPIVKKLVDMMGGTIDVESVLGKGSTFTITIDHKLGNEEKDKVKQEDLVVSKHSLEGKHVLLAEDNELNAEFSKIILEDCGLHVDLARDGLECVDKVIQKPVGSYDFILMDIQMPNMDGYQATQKIREFSDIPIVAMTANAFEEDKQKALSVGMNGYIAKPIDMDKVIKILSNVFVFKCPVCGQYTFQSGPGSYEICPVCGWEDDKAQYKDPNLKGGANRFSLKEYKEQYEKNHQ